MSPPNELEDLVGNVVGFIAGARKAARRVHAAAADDELELGDKAREYMLEAYAEGAGDACKTIASYIRGGAPESAARAKLLQMLEDLPGTLREKAEAEADRKGK